MLSIQSIKGVNFEKIKIDEFWNTGHNKELKIHRIHSYPAKFPSFITTKALEYTNSIGLRPNRIADIFCGCGTTAFESKRNGISFWGCDINPVATLIAKTKSQKYQALRLVKYYEKIKFNFKKIKAVNMYSSVDSDDRLKHWYRKKQYNDLSHLKKVLLDVTSSRSEYRLFFLCAFSNILKPTSMWLTKSIKPQFDPDKVPADVFNSFCEQIDDMLKANAELEEMSNATSTICTGNFLDNTFEIPKIDLIITSPPYVTSYEYADLHQLSSLWLDYVDDYRELRDGTIGSLHHDYNYIKNLKHLNSTGHKIVSHLLDQHKQKARSVAKYFLDMQLVASKSYSMLTKRGVAIFVIGNTKYKNVVIDNAKHLSESLIDSGFSSVNITKRKISNKILTPYRDQKGRFSTNSKGRKVYSEEFIVIGKKNE